MQSQPYLAFVIESWVDDGVEFDFIFLWKKKKKICKKIKI